MGHGGSFGLRGGRCGCWLALLPRLLWRARCANNFAVAPALAVFWVWIGDRLAGRPERLRSGRRLALAVLAGLALLNLSAQWAFPNNMFKGPRAQVETGLGPIQIMYSLQADYQALAALVDERTTPDAPLFAAGYGAQWYLLTERLNPTAFDLLIYGLGSSGAEASGVQTNLLGTPPAAVLLPGSWQEDAGNLSRDAVQARQNLPGWWQALQRDYVDQTPPDVRSWRVLLYAPKPRK